MFAARLMTRPVYCAVFVSVSVKTKQGEFDNEESNIDMALFVVDCKGRCGCDCGCDTRGMESRRIDLSFFPPSSESMEVKHTPSLTLIYSSSFSNSHQRTSLLTAT